jgi:hypothetical protein
VALRPKFFPGKSIVYILHMSQFCFSKAQKAHLRVQVYMLLDAS